MMVDDESLMIRFLRKYLRDAGYGNCVEVSDSTAALTTIRRERPDLILLDFEMPIVDGLEVLERIREEPDFKHTPVLMLTACADAEIKLRALELGATDFLRKPLDPNELIPRVRNTLITKSYHDDLIQLNGTLERRVSEQTAALRDAYAELKELDQLKLDFMTIVSHELRTPLTLCIGNADLLAEGILQSKEDRAESLRAIKQGGERLLRITRDIERMLSLTANSNHMIAACDLTALARCLDQIWRGRVEAKGISFAVEAEDAIEAETIDGLLRDCLDRLLDNALKFTTTGTITVTLRKVDGPRRMGGNRHWVRHRSGPTTARTSTSGRCQPYGAPHGRVRPRARDRQTRDGASPRRHLVHERRRGSGRSFRSACSSRSSWSRLAKRLNDNPGRSPTFSDVRSNFGGSHCVSQTGSVVLLEPSEQRHIVPSRIPRERVLGGCTRPTCSPLPRRSDARRPRTLRRPLRPPLSEKGARQVFTECWLQATRRDGGP